MIQKVLVTPIIGLPQINGWAQVTQSQDGTFIASFSINGSQAGNVGRDLVDLISNASPDSATSVYALVKKIIRFVEEKDCQVQVAVCYLQNGVTVFAAYHGALLLKRGEKLGCVLQADSEVKLIEGKRTDGDVFILMSQSALPFKEEIFQKLQQGWDADTTVASIVPGVQNLPDSSLVAMAFLTGRQISEIDELANRPLVEFSVEDQPEEEKNEEHDGNAVLGSPMIEVLAESPRAKKILFNKEIFLSGARLGFGLFRRGLGFLIRWLLKLWRNLVGVFSKKVYVDEKERVTNKWLRIIILIGLVGLIVAIGFLVMNFTARDQVKAAELATSESLTLFAKTKLQVESSPIEAREKLSQIIANLEATEKAFIKKPAGQKYVQAQLKEVRSFYDSVSGKQVFNELPVYYDFQLAQANFVANQSDFLADQGYFLDRDNKKIIKLELASKKAQVIDLASLNLVNDVGVTAKSLFVLGEGIFEKPNAADGEAKEVVASGKSNQGAKMISVFNDNLYVLNQEQRNIFKYTYSEADKKFGEPIRWVKSAKDLDFDSIASMTVDGNVWLSTKDGKIFRFSNGEGAIFEIKGLTEAFNSPIYLVTNEDFANLYLLEPAQSRLVVVSKQGDFVKEVKSVSLAAGNGLIPLENEKKVLVVSGTLIFEVGL